MDDPEDKICRDMANEIVRAETIRFLFSKRRSKYKISLHDLRDGLKESLNATEEKPFKVDSPVLHADGSIKKYEQIIYSKPLKDNATRLRAREMCCKLLDLFPAERHELHGTITHIDLEQRLRRAEKLRHGKSPTESDGE